MADGQIERIRPDHHIARQGQLVNVATAGPSRQGVRQTGRWLQYRAIVIIEFNVDATSIDPRRRLTLVDHAEGQGGGGGHADKHGIGNDRLRVLQRQAGAGQHLEGIFIDR